MHARILSILSIYIVRPWSDILTVESGLYYLEPQFGGQTRTFHRPHLSYLAIDFHYLHFDLQMKVNAGGCTHQLKLDVDSIFNIFISAY